MSLRRILELKDFFLKWKEKGNYFKLCSLSLEQKNLL